MWSQFRLVLFLFLWNFLFAANVTRRRSLEPLLMRQKRYLTFPTGSNLVLTLSFVKAIMQKQPKGYTVLAECDVPFPLPNDTRLLVNRHKRQRRELYPIFEESLNRIGLNGSACLKSFICDAQDYVLATKHPNSLVRDLLSYLFPRISEDTDEYCNSREKRQNCMVPLFDYIINSLNIN